MGCTICGRDVCCQCRPTHRDAASSEEVNAPRPQFRLPPELLLDYQDYLRHNGSVQWDKDGKEATWVRNLYRKMTPDAPADAYECCLAHERPEAVANSMICVIHQTCYLIDRQLIGLEKQFLEIGGFGERLAKQRVAARDPSEAPPCPTCNKPMRLRYSRSHRRFWGCSTYPTCKATRPIRPI